VITTKTFRNGGSVAVRIPAGWIEEGELTLTHDELSGEIRISRPRAVLTNLLKEFASSPEIDDPVFSASLIRERDLDQRSIFERQVADASN
jgi:virulence-associated protein VagC